MHKQEIVLKLVEILNAKKNLWFLFTIMIQLEIKYPLELPGSTMVAASWLNRYTMNFSFGAATIILPQLWDMHYPLYS